jgi:hypothetical protein
MFSVGKYYDTETQRHRWAVWCASSQVWYFPTRYGRKCAEALANRLNKGAV